MTCILLDVYFFPFGFCCLPAPQIYAHHHLIILFARLYAVNRDILLTSFFLQSSRLDEHVNGAQSGLANQHPIVQITRVPQRITETKMNKLTSSR